jgi:formate hydrogenlyase subunit 6/NADH:ubiquinone oxidoreductase subunit I
MAMEKELLKSLAKKPATLCYPSEKATPVEGIRAKVAWDIEKCIGCGLCPQICPSKAIELTGKGSEAEITYYLDRCLFCGECVDVCPTKTIKTTSEFELAFTSRTEATIHYKRSKPSSNRKEKGR